jgi:hypothetical protein
MDLEGRVYVSDFFATRYSEAEISALALRLARLAPMY